MSRPVSITASAVVALIGSILVLLFAGLGVASLFIETPQPQPSSPGSVIGGSAMFAAVGVFGICTSVGLFRLRPWARVSILILSACLAGICIFGLFVFSVVPLPADISGATKHTFYGFVVTAFGIPLLIAIWWLVQFNMRTTKAAFATSASVPASGKPVPVIALGWLSILGAAACAISVLTGAPAFLLGGTFTGSSAAIIYILFAAICIYIGKGLLDLDERTRVVAIWWYAFSFLQILLVAFVPSIRDRVFDLQTQIASNQSNPGPFDTDLALNVLLSVTSVFTAVILWILVQYRDAFTATQSA